MGQQLSGSIINRTLLTTIALVLLASASAAESIDMLSDGTPRKEMIATRITGQAPELDGRLDDEAWKHAIMVSDFTQKEPDEGKIPEDMTEVGILYDDHFLYIGARLHSNTPEKMRFEVNRRDDPGGSEQIIISLDTYCDRRTCYEFGLSAAGVRDDRYHPVDDEYWRDRSYNPVWEGRAHVNAEGWTAEMRIPFSQLRFNKTDEQIWGINLNRWIPDRREDNFWVAVPRNETGWSSRFGNLVGIRGIAPARRIELTPYVASDAQSLSDPDPGDPFNDGSEFAGRVGTDLKMGLGPNMTLDATINPDFGQVEADPAEVNLTAFETFFSEKRPFFIEGSQLFDVIGPTYFYSRRIGASPHGSPDADYDYIDQPDNSTILGAAKVTGRFQSGTSLGFLGALTSRENARVQLSGTQNHEEFEIEPVTSYGVLRVQQEFGVDKSTAGFIFTGVERDLNAGDPLSSVLHKRAYTGNADWRLRFAGGKYELTGYAGFSHVHGDSAAILATQKSSARYYQRPDADYVSVDPSRTSLSGYSTSLQISKRSGKHWLWSASASAESPGFDLNDAGILGSADDIATWGSLRYRENDPGPILRNYNIALYANNGWNFGGDKTYSNLELNINSTLANYYSIWLDFGRQFAAQSDDRTRGGPLMGIPPGWWYGAGINSNWSAKTRYEFNVWGSSNDDGGWDYSIGSSFGTRVGSRWSFSIEPDYSRTLNTRQYVGTYEGIGPESTFGNRYVFASIDRSQVAIEFRLNYFFTPDLSLEVYAEPFAASGRYHGFGELTAARERSLRVYGEAEGTTITESEDGTYEVTDGDDEFAIERSDFGFRSFRSNAVLRWEFRRGSTLFFVWQQNRAGDEKPGRLVGPGSLSDTFSASGDNYVAMKIAWWLPVS